MRAPLLLLLCAGIGACANEAANDGRTGASGAAGPRVIAAISRPTTDGKATYEVEFTEFDGAIATAVASPIGYTLLEPGDCALDTFLRVAPDDAVVPIELRRACSGGVAIDPVPVLARELRPAGARFEPAPAASAGPYCSKASYDARQATLEDAVAEQATKVVGEQVCDVLVFEPCTLYNAHTGAFVGICDPSQGLPIGGPPNCWAWHTELRSVPNPACDHPIWTAGSYGPWLDWEGSSFYDTSRLRYEVSACTSDETVVYWQMKRSSGDAYSEPKVYVYHSPVHFVLNLDAGTTGGGDWSGAKFLLHANGNGVHPVAAGARMKGIDRSSCPIGL